MFSTQVWRERLAAPRWKRAAIGVGAIAVLIQWVRLAFRPNGDFHLHWELGRRLAAGTFIYEGNLDYPYPPFWALAHAPLSIVPMHTAQPLVFPLFLGALVALLWALRKLTERDLPLSRDVAFWATAAAVLLASRYLVRDMLECGVNLALVAASYLGIYFWRQRREVVGGICLGAAMALKCTPTLFWAYFLWKRQWRMAATTFAAAALFTLSPALVMGPAKFDFTFRYWLSHALVGATTSDPSIGVLGPEPLQNMSLRPALARYLMHLPADHPGRPPGPDYVDFMDLSPDTAGLVIKGILVALAGYCAWRIRPRNEPRDAPGIVWECAALSLFVLLYSPITWGQHCVGLLPAAYLLCRRAAHDGGLPRYAAITLGAFLVVVIGFNRGFIGKDWTLVVDSYHVSTALLLALGLTTLALRPSSQAEESTATAGVSPPTIARRAA